VLASYHSYKKMTTKLEALQTTPNCQNYRVSAVFGSVDAPIHPYSNHLQSFPTVKI